MATQLLTAFIVDIIIGDPKWLPHPVRFIGKLITFLERHLLKDNLTAFALKLRGAILTLTVVTITYLVALLISKGIETICEGQKVFSVIKLSDLLIGTIASLTLALRCLVQETLKVHNYLKNNNMEEAKSQLANLVGRDTEKLSKEGIIKAAVETLAENTSDGIIAPAFYFAIGGLPLAFAYKAINTIDSMIGYKNAKYLYFGRIGARIDDIANFIPARITGIFIILAGTLFHIMHHIIQRINTPLFLGIKTILRDGQNHTSPNAGIPEAAIAGILGIALGGPNYYGGVIVDKPYIGTPFRLPANSDIVYTSIIVIIASTTFI
ncbi:MAG: adenosylcobinamide-phosphate synthase CbiB, partial [Candidatus Magnetoovum sp. WYHC-5]|nr:adenosylcobinamide-phosphate synthase CbiB [Candidatus Magnetoovum sp. WYHC-5]